MKKINNKLYFLENELKTNNKIRKSIILTEDNKYNTFFLSVISPILNNLIKGMSKVEFNNLKAKNYDLDYNVSIKNIDNKTLLIITISFIDLNMLNDNEELLDFIEKIFKGLSYSLKDLENTILDYKNYLNSLKDQNDKLIKINLNDEIFKDDENYLLFDEKIELINKINVNELDEFFKSINKNNSYIVFEGKKSSLSKVENLLLSLTTDDKLELCNTKKRKINKTKDKIEKIKNDNQISICLNFQANLNINEQHKLKILSYLFGRGVYSKLFTNVREKKSLCYSIYSIEDINYGIDVFTGVDIKNKEETINEIKSQFEEIKKGNFKKEFELAKKQYISEIIANKDNFNVQTNYLDKNIIYDTNIYNNESILNEVKEININDIQNFSKEFELIKLIILN